ncbi:MAG: hypothetical protein AAGD25_06805 [Cyanobacteria bacterium P01_F01_bin.150]
MQLSVNLEPDLYNDTAYQAFLEDLATNPPPIKTASVKRWKGHAEKPCENPALYFVEVRGMRGRSGYMRCRQCGMFDGWVDCNSPQ